MLFGKGRANRIHSYSIGTYLFAALVIVAVVVASLGAFFAVRDSRRQAHEAGLDAQSQAKLAAMAVSNALTESSDDIQTQTADPTTLGIIEKLTVDRSLCTSLVASGGLAPFPDGEIHFFDRQGHIFCSSVLNRSASASIAGAPWFRSLSVKPSRTAPFVDPINGKLSIGDVGWLKGSKGIFAGFATTFVFDSLADALTQQYGGRLRTAFNLVDTETKQRLSGAKETLWSGAESMRLGLAADAETQKAADAVTRKAVGGERRIYSYFSIPDTKWNLVASVQESRALASARISLRHQIMLALAAVLILLILGLLINRNIVRPIRRVRTAAEQAARDVTPAPLPIQGPSEITGLVQEFNAMIAAREQYEERLTHQALHDHLTGLPNRALLLDRISKSMERSSRMGSSVSVLFIDLDRFRILNDGLGHATGDRVLRQVAQRIEDVLRPGDSVARLNGDEFVVLCEDITSLTQASVIAERIQAAIAEPMIIDGGEIQVTASMGIAGANEADSATDLVRNADVAMMRAKEQGKARHEFFDESMHLRATSRLQIENDLRRAIERGELVVHYQPIVESHAGVIGTEALVRWHHPVSGLQLPLSFIPIAEETGLIVPIGLYVLEQACRQAAIWREAGRHLRVSVNLSAKQLADVELPHHVERVLAETGLPPSSLCLEITESVLMDESVPPIVLERLKKIGVTISIDDFGTGYSSLAYLQRFPVDELKIDRSFIRDLTGDSSARALVGAIIHMAGALDVGVVAEGVEDEEQLQALRELGCDTVQGYYLMRPVPAADLDSYLSVETAQVGAELLLDRRQRPKVRLSRPPRYHHLAIEHRRVSRTGTHGDGCSSKRRRRPAGIAARKAPRMGGADACHANGELLLA